jgi:hypothetical protein
MRRSRLVNVLLGGAAATTLLVGVSARASQFDHVVILSVDGLHEADLTDPNTNVFLPNILGLASQGISYTNAQTSQPSDSFPGALSYLTGATPASTGVFYDDSYARNLVAPGGNASSPVGTEVLLAENVDKNLNLLSGGGPTSGPGAYGRRAIDPARLPLTCSGGACTPVQPWQYNRVNTIFDVAHNAGLFTAYEDKHPAAYTIAAGPTGNAVDEFYSPEVNSQTALLDKATGKTVDGTTLPTNVDFSKYTLVDPSTTPSGPSDPNLVLTTNNYRNTEAYDDLKVTALINQLNGKTPLGDASAKVPNITAMNFQAVSVAQKLLSNASGTVGINPDGSVNPALQSALMHTDQSIKAVVDTLKADGLDKSTLVVLTAKHGQDPRTGAATLVKDNLIPNALSSAGIGVAQATQDDVSLIWLTNQGQTAAATSVLDALAGTALGVSIEQVLPGADFGHPLTDNRTPDLIIKLKPGYIYVGNTASTVKRAEHGGLKPDDLDVPLILSSDGLDLERRLFWRAAHSSYRLRTLNPRSRL